MADEDCVIVAPQLWISGSKKHRLLKVVALLTLRASELQVSLYGRDAVLNRIWNSNTKCPNSHRHIRQWQPVSTYRSIAVLSGVPECAGSLAMRYATNHWQAPAHLQPGANHSTAKKPLVSMRIKIGDLLRGARKEVRTICDRPHPQSL